MLSSLQFNAKFHVFCGGRMTWLPGKQSLLIKIGYEGTKHESVVEYNALVGDAHRESQPKSVKRSAVDPHKGIKIYLITAIPNAAEQIHKYIPSTGQNGF